MSWQTEGCEATFLKRLHSLWIDFHDGVKVSSTRCFAKTVLGMICGGLPQLVYELRVVRDGGGVPGSGNSNGGLSSVLFTFASRGDEPGFHRPACR